MRRFFVFAILASIASLASLACSSYEAAESPPVGPAADAGTADDANASTDAALGDAATNDANDAGAPGGLIANAGFESSTGSTCAPDWFASYSATEPSTIAHGGTRSCKVCNTNAERNFGVAAQLPFEPGQWVMKAHVRLAPDAPVPQTGYVQITFSSANGNYAGGGLAVNGDLSSEWVALESSTTRDNSNPPAHVSFVAGAYGAMGTCVLVDDVVVEHFQ